MPVIGEVITVSGDVRAVMDGAERVLDQGSSVNQGETILTAEASTVQIRLADESILAQGENASQTIDSFIYDPADASGSNMLINMAQGTFRMVTGKVGESNPEGVAVKTPLATIGIRGTGIDLDVQAALTKIGCFLYDGLDVTVSGEQGTRILNAVNTILDVLADGTFGEIRTYSEFEKAFFKAAAPILGIPEDQLYGDDQDEGDGDDGDDAGQGEGDDTGDGDTGEGDTGDGTDQGEQGENPEGDLAELFQTLFGAEGEPTNLLQQIFEALTEGTEGDDTGTGGTGQDTLAGGDDDDDDDDTLPGDDDDDGGTTTTVTDGDDDGSNFSTAGADHVIDGTSGVDDHHTGFEGTTGNDLMRAYCSDDDVWGKAGNDTMFGGNGNDTLSGDLGDDLMVGGTGDDELAGEGGADTLWGGSGADQFKYWSPGNGGDTIKDFVHGTDHIYFSSSFNITPDGSGNPVNGSNYFEVSGAYSGSLSGSGKGFVLDSNGDLWYDPELSSVDNDEELIAHLEGIGLNDFDQTDIEIGN